MDLFLAISQGTGVSLATGMRSFLPPLLVCALARGDLGVDFEGTDYEFLESVPFLSVLLLLNVVGVLSERWMIITATIKLVTDHRILNVRHQTDLDMGGAISPALARIKFNFSD